MKNKKKFKKRLMVFSCSFVIAGILFISLGIAGILVLKKPKNTESNLNINLDKTISAKEFGEIYTDINKNELNPILYSTFKEAVEHSKYYPTSFIGKLTHYGPDCALCGGKLACNGQDARGENIWYEDKEYGKLRIVATSKTLACGSIIKINIDEYDENGMYAIVLDRGVGPGIVDLLKESQITESPVRTVNKVRFDIVRYGYGK